VPAVGVHALPGQEQATGAQQGQAPTQGSDTQHLHQAPQEGVSASAPTTLTGRVPQRPASPRPTPPPGRSPAGDAWALSAGSQAPAAPVRPLPFLRRGFLTGARGSPNPGVKSAGGSILDGFAAHKSATDTAKAGGNQDLVEPPAQCAQLSPPAVPPATCGSTQLQQGTHVCDLPSDILLLIVLPQLSARQLAVAACVCRSWRDLADQVGGAPKGMYMLMYRAAGTCTSNAWHSLYALAGFTVDTFPQEPGPAFNPVPQPHHLAKHCQYQPCCQHTDTSLAADPPWAHPSTTPQPPPPGTLCGNLLKPQGTQGAASRCTGPAPGEQSGPDPRQPGEDC
jgi:hypothetical protein